MSTLLLPASPPGSTSPVNVARLLDNCTPSIAYDEQIQAACTAFDNQMFEIITDTGAVLFIPNILALTDETLVDILAWQFHVDFYDKTQPLEFRKTLVQNSIIWHRTKGTVQLVNDVINTYWPGGGYIQEWYEYQNPLPPNYPVDTADAFIETFAASDVNVPNDKFLKQNAYEGGEQIFLVAGHGTITGTLPAPLVASTTYFVVNPTSNSFQVAATLGGAPINITSAGTGTNELWERGVGTWHDRYKFRVVVNGDVIPDSEVPAVIALIERYKPVSRWPEGETLGSTSSTGNVYVFGYVMMTVNVSSAAADIR
jgi:P2-related tail formation protein